MQLTRSATAPVVATMRTGETARLLERGMFLLGLFTLGTRQFVGFGFTPGYLIAIAMLPVTLGALRRYWGAQTLFAAVLLALVGGIAISGYSNALRALDVRIGIGTVALFVGTFAGTALVLAARSLFTVPTIGLCFGSGLVVNVVLFRNDTFSSDPWKFGWAVAAAVLVLSQLQRGTRRDLQLLALLVLAVVSTVFDSRSYFAAFLLAAILLVWQMRPRVLGRRANWAWTAAFVAALGYAIYLLGSTLLVSGALGSAAQLRSQQQIEASGSLILGGRPELAASIALFKHDFWGFGPGITANYADVVVAKSGLSGINYDPNNGYVERYMFGPSGVELHSTLSDLWAWFGPFGILVVLVILVLVVRSLAESVSARTADGLLLFLWTWTLWNLLFSPFYSAAPTLILALGLGMRTRVSTDPAAGATPTSSTPTPDDRRRPLVRP